MNHTKREDVEYKTAGHLPNFYAIQHGINGPTITKTWKACKNQVMLKGTNQPINGAIWKRFDTLEHAQMFAYGQTFASGTLFPDE